MRKSELKKSRVDEGLADLADRAERDHEVQMARSDLYKIAKYAIKLHEMLKSVSEQEGLEGWVQSKITKSADYIGSVYHHLDYETNFEGQMSEGKSPHKKGSKKYKAHMAAMHAEGNYKETLAQKLREKSDHLCSNCGNPSWTTLGMTTEEIEEGERHGNDSMYDKCWKGYEKVPGKKRGEPGSCRKK